MVRLMGSLMRGIADAYRILRTEGLRRSLPGVFAHQVMVVHVRVTQKKTGDIAIVSRFVLDAFRRRAIAAIEIARQAGGTREVRLDGPHIVVSHGVGVGAGQPFLVLLALGFLRVVDGENHGGEKRRLRAAEIVAAVGVEDISVVFDLKEKILHHSARQIDSPVAHQAANDEVAVPAVHFVEAAAGNDVAIFQEEQSGRIEAVGVHFARVMDYRREMFDFEFAIFLQRFDGGGLGKIGGKIHHRGGRELGVHHSSAVVHGAREGVPAGRNIGADGAEAARIRGRFGARGGGEGGEEAKSAAQKVNVRRFVNWADEARADQNG